MLCCMVDALISVNCIKDLKNLTCTCNGIQSFLETDNLTIKCDFPAKVLDIQDSKILFFNRNFLNKIRQEVEILLFDSIELKYVDYSGFNGRGIKNITFRNNSLQEVSSLKIPTLEALYLEYNKIVDVAPFSNTLNLKEIYLSYNRLYDLSVNTFAALKFLKILKLNNNQLTGLPGKLLKMNYDLEYFDISSNFIKNIDQDFFKALPQNFEIRMTDNPCLTTINHNDGKRKKVKRNGIILVQNGIILVQNGNTTQLQNDLKGCVNVPLLNLFQQNKRIKQRNRFQQYSEEF